ncbi:MAG: hypothetical protein QOI26_568 [Pseudonocardiales bacterium]|nr:hypothetical protein [Pseudonocardiales bacterium]
MNSYYFSVPASGQQPYLFSAAAANQKPAVSVPLDQVFSTPPTGPLPTAAPFTLTKGAAPFSYQITVDNSIWTFDSSPIRPAVRAGFDSFLQALDMAGLKGGRLQQIRGWLAQALPQTFAESLYFRYGFDPVQRCVELSPGMRLRIDFQSHQSVDPGVSSLNGFVGAGRSWIEVGQASGAQGGVVLGFDPFLSQLQGLTVGASTAGAGGLIDLQGAAYQLPYWRLYYPSSYPSSDGTGFAGATQNPVLIGAPTRAALEAAGTQYGKDGTILAPAAGVWFRGRTVVVPEIPVLLQANLTYLTLGSTLRSVFAGLAPVPWVPGTIQSQFLYRSNGPLLNKGGLQWQPLSQYQLVAFNSPTYYAYSATLDSFDLPLVGGDSISFPATG